MVRVTGVKDVRLLFVLLVVPVSLVTMVGPELTLLLLPNQDDEDLFLSLLLFPVVLLLLLSDNKDTRSFTNDGRSPSSLSGCEEEEELAVDTPLERVT